MAELKKHAMLLSFMAILIIAKLVIMPVFDWQNNQLKKIVLLEKKQQKISEVLTGQSTTQALNIQLSKINKQGDGLFFAYQDESAFKLKQQKKLEGLLAEYDLKSERIAWQVTIEIGELMLKRYQVQIGLKGKTNKIIKLMMALESNDKRIEVKGFNVSFKGQRDKNLGQITGKLTLQLYAKNKA